MLIVLSARKRPVVGKRQAHNETVLRRICSLRVLVVGAERGMHVSIDRLQTSRDDAVLSLEHVPLSYVPGPPLLRFA